MMFEILLSLTGIILGIVLAEIAKEELDADVLPISVIQPMPKKKSVKIKKVTKESEEGEGEKPIVETVAIEEKEIVEEGEIMELANPEDEDAIDESTGGRESSEELQ